MKLIRNATVYLGGPLETALPPAVAIAPTSVKLMELPAPSQGLQKYRRRILLTATTPLDTYPTITNGILSIPSEARRRCESAIETNADLFAIYLGTSRTVSSVTPWIAFLPESNEDEDFLKKAKGVDAAIRARTQILAPIDANAVSPTLLANRPFGISLLADAISQTEPLAIYRELMRFFEMAFGLATSQMTKKVVQFLNTGPVQYSKSEVEGWFSFRHAAMHADRTDAASLVVQSDVRPIIPRLLQAARDVLFNKEVWHSSDRGRRQLWTPTGSVSDRDGSIDIEQYERPPLEVQLLDSFGAYPLDLSVQLEPPPPPIWAPAFDVLTSTTFSMSIKKASSLGSGSTPALPTLTEPTEAKGSGD